MRSYQIIYTDPPWNQKKGNVRKCRPNQDKELDYATMATDDIAEFHKPYFDAAEEKHNVFMWTIDKYLHETEEMMRSLGYALHARFIWDKCNGVAPAFTVRFSHEYLLWFYKKGSMLMPRKETRGKYMTVLREPSTTHSTKPDCAFAMIEDMFPSASKIELFARRRRAGWDAVGDQLAASDAGKGENNA